MTTNGIVEKLTQDELRQFESMLVERRRGLLNDFRALEEDEAQAGSADSALSTHLADVGSDRASSDVNLECQSSTSSEIRDIDDDGVWLYSNSTGRTYQIARGLLEAAWTALLTTGQLVPREVRMNYGAVTLLAHLPYVDYSVDPVTLYYPAWATHPLGSIRRRDDES